MNVAQLKELIKNLPDDGVVRPEWSGGPPSDYEPGVSIDNVTTDGSDVLVNVSLFYLGDNDIDEDEPYLYCDECGCPFSVDENGIATHNGMRGYEEDEDHVPYATENEND